MRRPLTLALIVTVVLAAPRSTVDSAGSGAVPAPPADELVVSAAASLGEALDELAATFERERGVRVLVNAGGSNSLARQIIAGAPVDVFISADTDQLRLVEAAGRALAGTRVVLLSNRLVVMTGRERAPSLRALGDLLDPGVRRIAAGDPTAVPAGVYARRSLEWLGL